MRQQLARAFAALSLGLSVLGVSVMAQANGQFPAAAQIVVQPGHPDHIVVRATFGILPSIDGGKNFDWICEAGANYGGGLDPGIAVTADGTIIAGTFGGVSVGHGSACNFTLAIGGAFIADVSVSKSQPSTAVAIGSESSGGYHFWRSTDNASTWTEVSTLPDGFYPTTVDVAPSDPMRVYASGGYFMDGGSIASLARSTDGGAHWTVLALPPTSTEPTPYIAGIDPKDPDTVWVRPDTEPGLLLVTRDGGASWATALTITGEMQAFAISPDGSTVLAGGPTDGLFAAEMPDAGAPTFTKKSDFGAGCLAWPDTRLFACGDAIKDGFIVGESNDGGAHFASVLKLPCVRGPIDCAATTSVGKQCPMVWPMIETQIGHDTCTDAGTPTGSTSGASSGGGAIGSTSASAGSTSATAGGGSVAPSSSSGGCGCGTAPASPSGLAAFASLGALLILRRNRRRRRA